MRSDGATYSQRRGLFAKYLIFRREREEEEREEREEKEREEKEREEKDENEKREKNEEEDEEDRSRQLPPAPRPHNAQLPDPRNIRRAPLPVQHFDTLEPDPRNFRRGPLPAQHFGTLDVTVMLPPLQGQYAQEPDPQEASRMLPSPLALHALGPVPQNIPGRLSSPSQVIYAQHASNTNQIHDQNGPKIKYFDNGEDGDSRGDDPPPSSVPKGKRKASELQASPKSTSQKKSRFVAEWLVQCESERE
jgi:hypothetical protein